MAKKERVKSNEDDDDDNDGCSNDPSIKNKKKLSL